MHRAFWLIGTTCVAIAGVLALDGMLWLAGGSVVLGVLVLWLAGQWVFPRGHDALAHYFGRVRSAWNDWATALQSAFSAPRRTDRNAQWTPADDRDSTRVMRAGETLARKLERMNPPAEVAAQHHALVSALRCYHSELADYYAAYRLVTHGQAVPSDLPVKSAATDLESAMDSLHDRLREREAWDVPLDAVTRR